MTFRTLRRSSVAATLTLSLAACGSDDGPSASSTSERPGSTVIVTSSATQPATIAPVTTPQATTTAAAPTTTGSAAPAQLAVWPAADVVIATPEQAAFEFVDQVLHVPPVLGEFQAGDSRSGEIEVFSAAEGGSPVLRSTLLVRQLGPTDGWFVIGAIAEFASIDTPASGATVPAGRLTVSGNARGYEATIIVTARLAGQRTPLLDPVIATGGGSAEVPEPYRAEIDLSHTRPGDVVLLLVRGDTGLETDPGEFSALPLVIAG